MNRVSRILIATVLAYVAHSTPCSAQSDFDAKPIRYTQAVPTDRVSRLQKQLQDGNLTLDRDAKFGWLPSLLKRLEVPQTSQTLVFSKTSLQFRRITPARPRAIYFNDEVYVGWVPGGDIVELAAVDPQLGAVFYTVQQDSAIPTIKRSQGECMSCHGTRRTQQVPGFVVRSVFTQADGQPEYRLGSQTTDHTTPLKDRFGGWYVTGQHGGMRHRGNVFVSDGSMESLDREAGANRSKLPETVRDGTHLEPTSDIVALMLLEHQSQMHNYVTNASYSARRAIHDQLSMNRILGREADYRSESTVRRIKSAADKLVKYMLFSGEFQLSSPIAGRADFVTAFAASAIRDSQGRSLRDLDLNRRLLRYPCSYLVYSKSFSLLPKPILDRVKLRMTEVLNGEDQAADFSHLSEEDRQNILEILRETHPLFRKA